MFSLSAFLTLGFAFLAAASPLVQRSEGPLKVSLTATAENAVIEAVVTNTGDKDLSILKLNSIFSDAPIQKVIVSNKDGALEFEGLRFRYDLSKLTSADYTIIKAGSTVKTTISLSATYDLSKSDTYSITAAGTFQYAATTDSSRLTTPPGLIAPFTSNTLSLNVDVSTVTAPLSKHLSKRVLLTSCSGTRQTALTTALSNTRARAAAAAIAALSGSATKFSEYFRTTSASTRATVAARLNAVAAAASSTTSGVRYYCGDDLGYCQTNVLAWTAPSLNVIANCDIYYTLIRGSTTTCHGQDQWTTTLHELTHAPGVFSPGTDDNAYGYLAAIQLSPGAALLNADTYALYTQAIYLNC
ncbi:Penicillolysin [Geopyxis carbonaria]|nr:Penicillolysin [Geopyxis carbonaria]